MEKSGSCWPCGVVVSWSGKYYHYIAERWGKDHRVAWKIDKEESTLSSVKHFRPKGGADRLVGVLLTEEIVGGM